MKITKEILGARIKELRKAKGLSQEQLAEKVDIEAKHVSRLELGKNYPSITTLEQIADALNVEMIDILQVGHHLPKKQLSANITKMLKEADDEKLRMIEKVVRAIVR